MLRVRPNGSEQTFKVGTRVRNPVGGAWSPAVQPGCGPSDGPASQGGDLGERLGVARSTSTVSRISVVSTPTTTSSPSVTTAGSGRSPDLKPEQTLVERVSELSNDARHGPL